MPRRRLLPALLALAALVAALAVGLVALLGIFSRERDEARAALAAERRALSEYAATALRQILDGRLLAAATAIDAASRDPLLAAGHLYLRRGGEQVLPRRVAAAPGEATPGADLYRSLVRGGASPRVPPGDDEAPRAERIALVRALRSALASGERAAIEETFRELLAQRARFVLPAAEDAATLLAALTLLSEKAAPAPLLFQRLLHDGLDDARGTRMEGLQRTLLRKRDRLTARDLALLAAEVERLSEGSGTPWSAFAERVRETPEPPVAVPADLPRPALLPDGWCVAPGLDGSVRGVKLDRKELHDVLVREMTSRGLLDTTHRVEFGREGGALSIGRATVKVTSPKWAEAERRLARVYRLKVSLALLCGALALGIAAVGAVAQERKRRLLEVKSDFVATVSHELRTPLASVRLLAETLESRTADLPAARDYPTRIVREVDALAFLVENILSFSRLERGRFTPRIEPVRLDELLDSLRQEIGEREREGIELTLDAPEGAALKGDPEGLKLLFANLLRNAVRHNERRPVHVRISVREGDGTVVRVTDNGVGIPRPQWDDVFEAFHRVRSEGAPNRAGSGLGLAICRRVMTAHGGTIRVADSSPEGTTFELTFR